MTINQQNSNFKLDYDTNNKNSKFKFIIEERRRLVAKLWAQSKSETEIARELHDNVSTICKDIKYLKKLSQQFVFDIPGVTGRSLRSIKANVLYYNTSYFIPKFYSFLIIRQQLYNKIVKYLIRITII